jgi:DNA polymerase III epsilon subunit-like protein
MPSIALPKCLQSQRVVVVDVETTGFRNDDRVIEVGLMWIEDCEIIVAHSKLFNPGCRLSQEIIDLTGITQEEVDSAEPFHVFADFLIDTMEGPSVVVAYNSPFDFRFLRKEVEWCGKELLISDSVIDPLPWVRNEDRGKKCSLAEAAKRRSVTINNVHRALADCYVTVRLMNTLKMPDTLMRALEEQHASQSTRSCARRPRSSPRRFCG